MRIYFTATVSILTFVAITYDIIVATKGGAIISEPKKMGRPTDSPKTIMFRVRIDEESLQKLEEAAEALQVSKSEVVRKGCFPARGWAALKKGRAKGREGKGKE